MGRNPPQGSWDSGGFPKLLETKKTRKFPSGSFLKKSLLETWCLAVVLTAATVVATAVSTTVVTATIAAAATTTVASSTATTTVAASAAAATTTVAASAASAAATTISTTASATTARTILHRTGFINSEVAAAHVGAAKSCDGCTTFVVAAHGDKSESAGAAGCAVNHDDCVSDGAVCAENLAEVSVGC
jgi:hypothetical protein